MQKTYETATGKIDYKLTNDIMFRLILERNQTSLNEFTRSLLYLSPNDIVEAEIQNPISLGESVKDKTFVLDVKILLNKKDIINIELQVINNGNWPDRSLSYLCRNFDNLMKGSDYSAASTVIHISILDFTLFPDYPEFYAHYRLMNVKNHQIYNDKFRLNVLCLNQIELAEGKDKEAGLDQWAALFRATTWEDIKMLAEQNPAFRETARELYKANADPAARAQAEAYEEYMRQERYNQRKLKELKEAEKTISKIKAALDETNTALNEANTALNEANSALAEKDSTIESQANELSSLQARIAELEQQLAGK